MRYPDDFRSEGDGPVDWAEACREQIKVLARDLSFAELDQPRSTGGNLDASILDVYDRAHAILQDLAAELHSDAVRKRARS